MTSIVQIKFGSHLYGTNTAQSDQDYKTVFLPAADDIILQRISARVSDRRVKSFGEKNTVDDVDDEAFALHRYLSLLAEGQTLALDMLFAPSAFMMHEPLPIWHEIVANRHRLVSRQAAKFVSYCVNQAKKYGIRGSYIHAIRNLLQWFDQAIEQYGALGRVRDHIDTLPAYITATKMQYTMPLIATTQKGIAYQYLQCCNLKVPYTVRLKEGRAIYQRMMDSYGSRALMAESNLGCDWKALSHAVRIAREAIEFLDTGWITFPRPDAAHLLAIKLGQLPYREVANEIETLLEQVMACQETSILPEHADHAYIDELVIRTYGDVIIAAH